MSWFGKKSPSNDKIRDTLFGDMPIESWGGHESVGEPWTHFSAARQSLEAGDKGSAIQSLTEVVQRSGLESRHYIQAWHFLRQLGGHPTQEQGKILFGVVVEVSMGNGFDLLACYADLTARYYNYSGAGVVWEHPDLSLDDKIKSLLGASQVVLDQIGPWEGGRPAAPPKGQVRISMLTPSGLHFGQGPFEALASDRLGGPVVQRATELMKALIEKTGK